MRKKLASLSALSLGASFMVMGGAAATSTLTQSASATTPACNTLQTYKVPAGAKVMTVVMYGADGGEGGAAASGGPQGTAGAGGGLKVKFNVRKGQEFSYNVGCGGQSAPGGSGVTGTGGAPGAGALAGGSGGNGYYCTGANSNDTPCFGSSGDDGSGGGGGAATILCHNVCGVTSPPWAPLAIAGGGGAGGETMCGGTNGGAGGNGGTTTLDGGAGGSGGSSGEPGGSASVTGTGTFSFTPGHPGSSGWHGISFGDSAGGGGGGGGFNAGNGGNGGADNEDADCQAAGGGGAGASWVSTLAARYHLSKSVNSGGPSAPGRLKVSYTS
jgi:hypothetical protein